MLQQVKLESRVDDPHLKLFSERLSLSDLVLACVGALNCLEPVQY
jgi:hypothetical protein